MAVAAALTVWPLGLAAEILAQRGGLLIEDGYVRAAGAAAATGAAYLAITNQTGLPDRLIGARSAAAERVELHVHTLQDGIARMTRIEGGIVLPPGETVTLERGGRHVMFLGLTAPLEAGASVAVTLVFATAGEIEVAIPVDLARAPDAPDAPDAGHDHAP